MKLDTQNLDNLGLVAGMCDELDLAGIIDREVGEQAHNKTLSYGEVVKCMLLNGLGFVGRTLYLYSEYFEDKPLSHLLHKEVQPEKIDDNLLGRALDKLFDLGVTSLFTKIALKAVRVLGIDVKSLHLDSTSFHVDGQYTSLLEQGESRIQLIPGYSRDHRPDLNQAVLHLITSNQGNLPLYMQAADGNSSDKKAFSEIVKAHVTSFQQAVKNKYFVGDSALYTPKSLRFLQEKNSLFVTRVPNQIQAAKLLIQQTQKSELEKIGKGYFAKEVFSEYAGVPQRWIVVYSEAMHQRACQTHKKHLSKGTERENKDFWHLKNQEFSCKKDAEKALARFSSQLKYTEVVNPHTREKKHHAQSGRPPKGAVPERTSFTVEGVLVSSLAKVAEQRQRKGYFILSTNDLNTEQCMPSDVLKTYKEQQSVERGFRFLKSPDFLVSSFYLKKPERIEALLMVMTLCLLVYAAIEYKVRSQLVHLSMHFLDQKKRPSQKPTTRWIFFCFLGLHLQLVDGKKRQINNVKERHRIILRCLGPPDEWFYYAERWGTAKNA